MKFHKSVIPLSLVLISFGVVAQAWFSPIQPGDHVFDAKRFRESVLQTAKQAIVASQTAKEMTIRILQHTGIKSPGDMVTNEMNRSIYEGQTLINPDTDITDTPVWWQDRYVQQYDTTNPEMEMYQYLAAVHKDAAGVEQDVMYRYQSRLKTMQQISQIEAPGRMGELQKGSSLSILRGMNMADEARLDGAQMAASIADSQVKYNEEYLARMRTSLNNISTVDPYIPDEGDIPHMPAIDNFGFLSTQQTE